GVDPPAWRGLRGQHRLPRGDRRLGGRPPGGPRGPHRQRARVPARLRERRHVGLGLRRVLRRLRFHQPLRRLAARGPRPPGRARRRDRPGCPGRGGRARLPMSAAEFGVDVTPGADGVAWLVLRNPARRNAVRLEMWQAIPDAVRSLTVDPNVRVLVMRGHGEEAFASGADISEFATHRRDAAAAAAYEETTARAFEALLAVEQPVVAMIHG